MSDPNLPIRNLWNSVHQFPISISALDGVNLCPYGKKIDWNLEYPCGVCPCCGCPIEECCNLDPNAIAPLGSETCRRCVYNIKVEDEVVFCSHADFQK